MRAAFEKSFLGKKKTSDKGNKINQEEKRCFSLEESRWGEEQSNCWTELWNEMSQTLQPGRAYFIVSANSSPHTHTQSSRALSQANSWTVQGSPPRTLKCPTHLHGLWWGFVGLLNIVPPLERFLSNAVLEHNSQLKWCIHKPVTGYCCCNRLASHKTRQDTAPHSSRFSTTSWLLHISICRQPNQLGSEYPAIF